MRKLALAVVTLFLAASAVVGVAAPATAAPADSLYSLVNQERAANGLPALARNASIEAVAVNWANQMAASGTMGHNPSYSSQIPSGWTAAAENVAQGQPTAAEMHRDWMNSPGHRANILGDYTSIGIAFVTANGTTWGVENFAKYASQAAPAPSATPAPPSAKPAPAPAQPTATKQPTAAQPPAAKPIPTPPTPTPPTPTPPTPTPPTPTPTASPEAQPTPSVSSPTPSSESAPPYAASAPRASSSPEPDATALRPSTAAAETPHNPAPAFTLLGLALSAATAFIVRASRRGRWSKHRS
jgi:hypothetical protein